MSIPKVILDEFLIDKDKIYFLTHNNLETKHFLMMEIWKKHFKPKTVLDLGCGLGLFGKAATICGLDYTGLELSKWAVENEPFNLNIKQGDITKKHNLKDFDLVLVIDVLEHLEPEDLDKKLNYIKEYGKNFVFSLPFLGDPNLDEDITHKIKYPKNWWLNKLSEHFDIQLAPAPWYYSTQTLIGVKK